MPACRSVLVLACLTLGCPAALAQPSKPGALKAPEPGYVFPPGGPAGGALDVVLGGYDWTPDVQVLPLDPRVRIESAGGLGPVLVPPPPYWFGPKGTLAPPLLPRERPARLMLPAGLTPGPVRWAVAGAGGAGARTGTFWVGDGPEVVEDQTVGRAPQPLPTLPVTVNGRLSRIEEVDRYRFTALRDGPVTCEVFARRLGVDLNAAVTVRDARGTVVADAVDTAGRDLAVTFRAAAGGEYVVSVSDLDFRGDRAFVYRLAVTPGPRVVATVPAAGRRGESCDVEFVGHGVRTGGAVLESVTRRVTPPAEPGLTKFAYRLDTPHGTAPAFAISLSDLPETVAGPGTLVVPAAVTGVLDGAASEARFACAGKKGDMWEVAAEARRFGSPLDLTLAVLGPDGKELARSDDLPDTTDAGLTFTVPADGTYTLAVGDLSGRTGTRAAVFRLTVAKPARDFGLSVAARLNVPVGGGADLVVTAARTGGHAEPITLVVAGLPDGAGVPPGLVIPAGKSELKIPVTVAPTAPASARLVAVTGTAGPLTRPALARVPGDLTVRHPAGERTPFVLVATTLAPRIKVVAVEADGGRKVHRGSTHPAEVTVERFDGFAGEVSLQMSAAQSYQRQGITGPDFLVPAGAGRALYPCFMPEWLETSRTSRMELVGVVRVPDARGTVRHLVTPMAGRITMSIEGALLKIEAAREVRLRPGEVVAVPVAVLRSAKLAGPVRLELRAPEALAGRLAADPVTVAPGQAAAVLRIACGDGPWPAGGHAVTVRATALQDGRYPVVSEATVTVGGR